MKRSSLIIGIAVIALFVVLFAVGGKKQPAANGPDSGMKVCNEVALSNQDSSAAPVDDDLCIKQDMKRAEQKTETETQTNQAVSKKRSV